MATVPENAEARMLFTGDIAGAGPDSTEQFTAVYKQGELC